MPGDPKSLLADALGLATGADPFPWQVSLLKRLSNGDLPSSLDIPTGLGKTSVIGIWLAARILSPSSQIPRRLAYVVDRRAVVDQATTEAERIAHWLDANPGHREALGLGQAGLPISTLRGQFADNRRWLENPSLPAVVVGTVDMVGSRLLFEGYGVSRKSRPMHAGLLGHDTLFVLDEAHLVPPFAHLLREATTESVELGLAGRDAPLSLPRSRLMALSATVRGASDDGAVHRLSPEDIQHEVVRQRIHASKRLTVEELAERKALPGALAKAAWQLAEHASKPSRILVFATSRDDAEKCKQELERRGARADLFVGGRRAYERRAAADRLEGLGFLAGKANPQEGHTFLCATSAAEVGVDLDADHMACDLVAFERMVQRLGRVNRRGTGAAEVVVLSVLEKTTDLEASALAVLGRLRRHPNGGLDASPDSLVALQTAGRVEPALNELIARATTPAPLRPALERPLLDAWAMTSLWDHTGRPEVAPWLRGWVDEEPQTTVVWRRRLPPEGDRAALQTLFEAAPPHLLEKLETETRRVTDLLAIRAKAQDFEGLAAVVLGSSLEVEEAFTVRALRNAKHLDRKLSGRVLVLHADLGGLSPDGLLDPKEGSPASTPEDTGRFEAEGAEPDVPFRVRRCVTEGLDAEPPMPEGAWRRRLELPVSFRASGEPDQWLVVERWLGAAETEEDRSTASRPQRLDEHQEDVESRARRIGSGLALPEDYRELLALAGRLHDEGKRARRWQRAFAAPANGPWAKTRGPVNTHMLDGYRHELGSIHLIAHDQRVTALADDQRDLLLHLIVSHHGFARPVISQTGFDDLPPTAVTSLAREVALRYLRLQERWGPWGLAWWEALLRAADQWASRDNDEGGSR
ncbi:MAG: type I-U CRISPR-associated helicase/endonuclease Cas3 [Deltaproteobacteria bacterium]|nr:type I-U CRISPR-associated helicase/endonuclease Cas3 [Deltaproteobacteria bacterium]